MLVLLTTQVSVGNLKDTNPGDFVLDPFSGSGTTAVVAALDRRYLAIDLSENYVELGRQRLKESVGFFSSNH